MRRYPANSCILVSISIVSLDPHVLGGLHRTTLLHHKPPNAPHPTTSATIATISSVPKCLDREAAPKKVPGAIVASLIPPLVVPLTLPSPLPAAPATVPLAAAAVEVAKPPEMLEVG